MMRALCLVVALALLTGCVQVVVEPTPTPRPTRSVSVARYSARAVLSLVQGRYLPLARDAEAAKALTSFFSGMDAALLRDGVWAIQAESRMRGTTYTTVYWEYYEDTDELIPVHEMSRLLEARAQAARR